MKTIFTSKKDYLSKLLPLLFITFLIAFDQFTKFLAISYVKPLHSIKIIENFFYFTFVENRGAAFGIFQGATSIFIVIALFVSISSIYFYNKPPKINNIRNFTKFNDFNSFKSASDIHSTVWKISIVLLISGALGNMMDRIFRGYVVDMIHFIFWGNSFAVFNIADIYVCVGTFLLSILILFSETN